MKDDVLTCPAIFASWPTLHARSLNREVRFEQSLHLTSVKLKSFVCNNNVYYHRKECVIYSEVIESKEDKFVHTICYQTL